MQAPDLQLLITAARSGGEIAKRYAEDGVKHWQKPDGAGPVTEADLAVNAHLHNALTSARPDYGWLSEEDVKDPRYLDKERMFIIDPIDGTRSFIEGSTSWSLSLAILSQNEIQSAVVYLPMLDRLYIAERGQGAWCNDTRLVASPRTDLDGAQILATKATLNAPIWCEKLPQVERHHRPSLAYRLALIAEGRFDAAITLRPTWVWDIAAGYLIAAEAGAPSLEPNGQAPQFRKEGAKTSGLITAPEPILRQIVTKLT